MLLRLFDIIKYSPGFSNGLLKGGLVTGDFVERQLMLFTTIEKRSR